ncbi:hypothetical protein [Sinorhizobium fredii]|uniref:Uncharacterized protein n=1 Tax=Sinorhizobium fredii (strain HH103) TaxID=1117943 RepID=G9A1I5_SINF1|nr:hypothetical protein [Sinorhizobium fredii]CCE97565.1 hypothetical protein SFHH103_03073 [Sinorhizobium fredii HH103]
MARKYEVTFQGSQGQVAKVSDLKGNVAIVKFAKRRQAKRFPGQFSGVLVKPAAH